MDGIPVAVGNNLFCLLSCFIAFRCHLALFMLIVIIFYHEYKFYSQVLFTTGLCACFFSFIICICNAFTVLWGSTYCSFTKHLCVYSLYAILFTLFVVLIASLNKFYIFIAKYVNSNRCYISNNSISVNVCLQINKYSL